MAEKKDQNIKQEFNNAATGLNLDQSLNQIQKGRLTYALNASLENFDANSVNYQNEPGNDLCMNFPEGYVLIGSHYIIEQRKHIFFLSSPLIGGSQIGFMVNNDCVYHVLVNAPCLNFDPSFPIQKVVHRITNCSTEIYWPSGNNPRRYLDIDDIPKILRSGSPLCSPIYSDDVDCNQLKLQPIFSIPSININKVIEGGNLIAGTYQFAVQYGDSLSNPFTSYYSVTNPLPIADVNITTVNFNYPVGKSIIINISDLDTSGQFEYFNLAVIKTINTISTVELIGTFFIDSINKSITYTGQNVSNIQLSIFEIFEKFPYYEIAEDLTTVQDVLVWDKLTSIDRVNYQSIASKIELKWESWRIPAIENYADETNATNLRSYLRDEVYAFEIVFLLQYGIQTDGFHIPGRALSPVEKLLPKISFTDPDFIGEPDLDGSSDYWKIYNTATTDGFLNLYSPEPEYKGPYQYGSFAYWESTEEYPCNVDLWGELAGQKIKHHKFPDVAISPIYESKMFLGSNQMVMGNDAVFPIGVKLDIDQIKALINSSDLTREEKSDIIGFKIVRGDRGTNKSIIAKGMLRNVGQYTRDDQDFFFPNYPYNDLSADVFLNEKNNAYQDECESFDITIDELGPDPQGKTPYAQIQYYECSNNKITTKRYDITTKDKICSIGKPTIVIGKGNAAYSNYDRYELDTGIFVSSFIVSYIDRKIGPTTKLIGSTKVIIEVVADSEVACVDNCNNPQIKLLSKVRPSTDCGSTTELNAFSDENRYRQIFNSPETSFGQPFLGNVLKLESVMFGLGKAHFTEVKDNAKYKLISLEAQKSALDSSQKLGRITDPVNVVAMFTAYQAYLTIYINAIVRRNYAYSFNSIADYNYGVSVPDGLGIKQRKLDVARYLNPGVQSVGDVNVINNYQRESSVFLKTDGNSPAFPFPNKSENMLSSAGSIVTDSSRFTISGVGNCNNPGKEESIEVVAYYASIKNNFVNQWGQIYSYETIDTGYQKSLNSSGYTVVFGGDTFISRFTYKTKLPFFIDNRVGAPDDSDIFYDEIGNISYPKYWHSARSIFEDYNIGGAGLMINLISYKAHNFDCPNDEIITTGTTTTIIGTTTTSTTTVTPDGGISPSTVETYYDGYFYLFAYGVPNFYCETSFNVDLRQAFNNKEGEFWPHVNTDIPDDWFQEKNVSIANDNTYYYNITFSKQNKENNFTHLPFDWEEKLCFTQYPFRAIYSDLQNIDADNKVNNWLIYRAVSYFDFPQNYGNLISLDGIQNKAILARFENKTLIYNNLLTVDTSNPQAAFVGNPTLFKGSPPIDFAETDIGYIGSQHKMLLKIPEGQVTVDSKRGQVFLITGNQATDLSSFGSGMNKFFTDNLPFEIRNYFPDIDIDNNFNGFGLHGVFDARYDRIILTKIDYIPLINGVKYDVDEKSFYILRGSATDQFKEYVDFKDPMYFCNKSWTLSFNMNTRSWISFHSYVPNWYIGDTNFFYSGINSCCDDFEFIVGSNLIPIPFTTTTTTTDPLVTTSTTTTFNPFTTTTTTTDPFSTTTTTTTVFNPFQTTTTTTTNPLTPTTTTTTTAVPTTTTTTSAPLTTTTTTAIPTTTTTTTSGPLFPTTTTTTTVLDCQFTAVVTQTNCNLLGTGYIIEPTTTTTTTVEPTTTTTTTVEPTTTTTTTVEPTTTTTTTFISVGCNSFVESGGSGISDYFVTMDNPNGGLITFDFNAESVPDKLEIIHMLPSNVFIKKATSSMDANNNSSSFDNVYGTRTSNVIPSRNVGSINQFIGSIKGSIPTRYNEFVAETGVTNLPFSSGKQQRIWWVYTASDYANSNQVNIRITGDNGTVWDFIRVCEIAPTTTTTTTVVPTTTTTTTTLPYSGTCGSYSITDDGDTDPTTYNYYEYPSGTFITNTVTFSNTNHFNAYSNPGVTIISGDAFAVFIESC